MPKAKDFSASAVNLCNPPEIGEKLKELHDAQSKADTLDAVLKAIPEYEELQAQQRLVGDITAQIKGMIDAQGSYQDLDNERYALKYSRATKQYHAEPFIENYPKYAPAVIENSVNVKALEGLLKGGLLTEEGLEAYGVLTKKVDYAYYVRLEVKRCL